ncbi:Neutral/alkaline non-lysosomal ceramidase C-terminal [Arabidopsis suecica]|uniref:Neutral/alkaline non-lysosomal ceramidase C-terminal n=1 Tax=Arabidopsis suecica TaxID=45249 RepID=A0A8T2AGF4_ARASU|nr:Neutral/alkaline non-lysosomal ceramidase C-terminal [Arabidopsis suecica]
MAGRRVRDAITSFLISLDSKEFGNNKHLFLFFTGSLNAIWTTHTHCLYPRVQETSHSYLMTEGSFAVVETLREGGKWVRVYNDDDFSLKFKWSRPAKLRLSGGYRNLRSIPHRFVEVLHRSFDRAIRFSDVMVVETQAQGGNQETKAKGTEVVIRGAEELMSFRIEQVMERTQAFEGSMIAQNQKINRDIADMLDAIRKLTVSQASSSTNHDDRSSPVVSAAPENMGESFDQTHGGRSNYSGLTRLSKVDFPRFNGEDVTNWLFKVEEFFGIDRTPHEMKVRMASIHFDGVASTWHNAWLQSQMEKGELVEWESYKLALRDHFEDVFEDPIAELKQLQETEEIVPYHEKFELIRTRVHLSEEYLVSAYLAGLRLDTQMHVRMFRPQSIRQCLSLGRLYEKAHQVKPTSSAWVQNRNPGGSSSQSKSTVPVKKEVFYGKGITPVSSNNSSSSTPPRKFLTNAEMSDRRARGLCYYCDEKFTPEHFLVHKKTQLFMIKVDEDQEEGSMEEDLRLTQDDGTPVPRVSVNAVHGLEDYTTMRVKGMHDNKYIFILLDSGSTHNFMDVKVASKLGCSIQRSGLKEVAVADGGRIGVHGKVDQFHWKFHTTSFVDDFMLIPLGGCDVVLGVQWLRKLGPISWDFNTLEMGFVYEKQKTMPTSTTENMMICAMEAKQEEVEVNPALLSLLQRFQIIFEEPKALPPFRENHNHRIPLLEGSNHVNQRPYRYALYQKNEIDKIVKELLVSGTIQPSSSPYASPVVLVKKKDGTWRLCVDYRGLNGMTIKDRFPIPLIEDLMDELGGSTIYSKIDLRAGYHQVQMELDDIPKTAFKTHSGHYEYVVMPFGLTNAPATFQSLMNSVFQEFLRKFVLIFFDDILVYSSSMELHVKHLEVVFELMQQNNLFAKRSKCDFAISRVEYLGHYIEEKGVSTDPNKIRAVSEWPKPANLKQLRGFLGLAGYYRRFVKNFGIIAKPLTALTMKDSFLWNEEAQNAFEAMKKALCEAPVLALPMFDKPFVVETDACGQGIGAVLMQEGHPLAYISRQLKGRQLHLSIYDKELLAVVFAWLPKMLEFDYEIQYKQGKENLAADALSRVESSEVLHMAMSILECDLIKNIQALYSEDLALQEIIDMLQQNKDAKKHFSWTQGSSGHSGRDATHQRVKGLFYWKGMSKDIQSFICSCVVCQQHKYETVASPGLLQPLPIPDTIWSDISMDFIDGLPPSAVAQAFLDNVFKLHGSPKSIVSDRDTVFLSTFWQELFSLQGTSLNFSSAYHPQSDGQTEVVNRCLETYLRCMCSERPLQEMRVFVASENRYLKIL